MNHTTTNPAARRPRIVAAIVALCCLAALVGVWALPGSANANSSSAASQQIPAQSVKLDGVDFGIQDFERVQTGFKKKYQGEDMGFVFPMGEGKGGCLTLASTGKSILVYVPPEAAKAAGFDASDENDCMNLEKMLQTADDVLFNGGTKLSSLSTPWVFTSEKSYEQDGIVYRFDTEIESGYYYLACTGDGATDSKTCAEFVLRGQLLPASQVVVAESGGWFADLMAFLDPANLDYRPLWVSLKTSFVAMVFIFIFGLLVAWRAMHVKSRWKGVFDSIFTIPMVLPPTVCGFILLVVLGQSSVTGRWLIDHGISLVFTWPAAVIAAVVVGFPLMYRTALGAFESLDENMLDAARTLGWSERRIFARLMLPLAWPSIASGLVLAFARAMGEFGATLFVAGNFAGSTQTMPIAIYFAWMGNNTAVAVFWVVVVIIISFVIILIINIYSAHVARYRSAGGKLASKAKGTDMELGNAAADSAGLLLDRAMAAELLGVAPPDDEAGDGKAGDGKAGRGAGTGTHSASPAGKSGGAAAGKRAGRSETGSAADALGDGKEA